MCNDAIVLLLLLLLLTLQPMGQNKYCEWSEKCKVFVVEGQTLTTRAARM